MPPIAERVLFLGLDGATMSVLGPLFDRGWLPNLASLWRRSATGTLRSTMPMVTPVAWSSFATGMTPKSHGILDFQYLDPADRTVRSNHAGRLNAPHLWELLGRRGRSVVSLNLPMTWPCPPVRGIVVAGADAPGRASAFAQCPDFGDELAAEVPAYTHKLLWKTRPRTLEALKAEVDRTIDAFHAQAEAAIRAEGRVGWSALMVHFHNLDGMQHRLWPYLDLDETAAHQPAWTAQVARAFRALDDAAGRLLELADRRGAAVIAASDHGFGPCKALVDVNGLLRKAGLQRGLAYGTRFRYRLNRIADRLRRHQSRLDGERPRTPRSLAGLVGCDWRRTAAFAPYGQLCAHVYLNEHVAGVGVIDEVVGVLRSARDPSTGDALFADAFAVADRFGLDPAERGLPAVMAPSADGYQAQAKWDRAHRSPLAADWDLPATHRMAGVLALDAPGVRAGASLDTELHDVAPTALAILGLEAPAAMEGTAISEAFRPPSRINEWGRPAPSRSPLRV